MPVHDWRRVSAGTFHDFHATWIVEIKRKLNSGFLPPEYYAMAEQVAGDVWPDVIVSEEQKYVLKSNSIAIRTRRADSVVSMVEILSPGQNSSRSDVRNIVERMRSGIHLLLIDLFPPAIKYPQGIHGAIWADISDDDGFELPSGQPLTLVAYSVGKETSAYIEPFAVGEALPEMPLFFNHETYVSVPLETTYQEAYAALPRRWQEVLEKAD